MPLSGEYEPSPREADRKRVETFERTGGAEGATMRGFPVIVLTTRGARTGKIRKTPLMRVEHNGQYAVVASLGGSPQHPVWYHNIVANPRVDLQDGPVTYEMLAHEATGEEKVTWWALAVAAFPDYDVYQARTDREIPLFVLTPITS